jgi:hypothetical protein
MVPLKDMDGTKISPIWRPLCEFRNADNLKRRADDHSDSRHCGWRNLSPELMREFYGWRPCDGARPLNGGGRKDVMTRDFTFEEAATNGY